MPIIADIGINARILIGIDRHWALIEAVQSYGKTSTPYDAVLSDMKCNSNVYWFGSKHIHHGIKIAKHNHASDPDLK